MDEWKIEWKIDKGIPIAVKKGGRGRHANVDRMEVGDSVFFNSGLPISAVSGRFSSFARSRPGWKFACREVVEDGVTGVRVWRIA